MNIQNDRTIDKLVFNCSPEEHITSLNVFNRALAKVYCGQMVTEVDVADYKLFYINNGQHQTLIGKYEQSYNRGTIYLYNFSK